MGSNRRTVIAAVAILLAVVAGVAAYMYLQGADERAQEKVDLVDAFVAGSDIPRNTTGQDAVANNWIVKKKVARASRPDTALASTAGSFLKQVAAVDIARGQFVVTNSFVDKTEATSALGDLAKGMQAVTISIDDARGVAGFIQPGDHVNLLQYAKLRKAPDQQPDPSVPDNFTSFVLQNVRVLAVGRQTSVVAAPTPSSESAATTPVPQSSGLITLEVSPVDAERVVMAAQGTMWLTLVPKGFKPETVAPVIDVVNLGWAGVPPSNLIG